MDANAQYPGRALSQPIQHGHIRADISEQPGTGWSSFSCIIYMLMKLS